MLKIREDVDLKVLEKYGYFISHDDLDELFEINEAEKEIEVIGNIYENEVD